MPTTAQTVQERISRQLGLMADSVEALAPECSPVLGLLRRLADGFPDTAEDDETSLRNEVADTPPLAPIGQEAPTGATNDAPEKKRTRRSQSFSQRDLARAMRAAKAEGITARFEVVGDKIVIVPIGKSQDEVEANGHDTDAELEEFVRRHDKA
jgi:hypothetical protein